MIKEKLATTSQPIHDVIARRWSPRAMDPDMPVAREQLIAMLEAARWAPSCFGDEPWRFIVWDRFRDADAWQKAFDCLAEGNQVWVKDAPLIMAALADTRFRDRDRPNRWGEYDTGAAAISLCLQAAAFGLVSHQMGGFDPDKLRETFSMPERFTPMAMIAVGHAGDPETLGEGHKKSELGPRRRRDLDDSFFESAWESAVGRD